MDAQLVAKTDQRAFTRPARAVATVVSAHHPYARLMESSCCGCMGGQIADEDALADRAARACEADMVASVDERQSPGLTASVWRAQRGLVIGADDGQPIPPDA